MNALQHLASLLDAGNRAAGEPWPTGHQLDPVLFELQRQVKAGSGAAVPADLQRQALERFWATQQLGSMRDARLVCFGLTTPVTVGHACLLDDSARLLALLKGVDALRHEPRRFRRCYQGLVRGYFSFDGKAQDALPAARANWERLRAWLAERLADIATPGFNPEWVMTAQANRALFGTAPGEPYAAALLRGVSSTIDRICTQLGIPSSSWFMRELMLMQLREATRLDDAGFLRVLERLLEMLGRNAVLRDQGVAMLLERHAQFKQPVLHKGLFHAAALCWGNPMLHASAPQWRKVSEAAREMVAGWLKPELIDAFFAGFGDDAVRRAAFWKRYAIAIDDLRFVIGEGASSSLGTRPGDPPLLRRKLEGATSLMIDKDKAATALVMRLGNVTLVEFGNSGHGMYGYGSGSGSGSGVGDSASLPFDPRQPLTTVDPAPNTLRHPSRTSHLQHRDGQQGWATWEAMFEALLARQYGIEPGRRRAAQAAGHVDLAVPAAALPMIDLQMPGERDAEWVGPGQAGLSAHWQTAEAGAVEFGRAELAIFARVHALRIEDNTRSGGSVRVLAGDIDEGVKWVLTRWGFVQHGEQGWVREQGYR